MADSPTQHRHIVPGPSPQYEISPGESPTEERRGSMDTKKRCSGERPCDNCRAFGRECIFDETLDQRRRVAAKRTADELNYHRDMLNDLLKVMRAEDETYALKLLEIIRRDATAEEIRAYIDHTLSIVKGTRGASEEVVRQLANARHIIGLDASRQSFRPQVMDIHYLCGQVPFRVPAQPWTTVTTDGDLVSHLVSLYFTWDYPFYVFLDRDVFLKHMVSGDTTSELCSPFLVNALLANACHFSTYSEAYVTPGDIITKGNDFLAEAERLRDKEPGTISLSYLQGTLMLYEKYSLSGKNDLGYKMLHRAIHIGKNLGLIGNNRTAITPGFVSEDLNASLRRTSWGLFHIDSYINLERPDKHRPDQVQAWWPYPTDHDRRPSYLNEYFDESCNLCEIARDMSQWLFAINKTDLSAKEQNEIKDNLYERLRHWNMALSPHFTTEWRPPPYVLIMRMRYHTLIINLFLYHAEDELLGTNTEGMETPESPSGISFLSKYNKRDVTQSAAREIAALARQHREDYGMNRAHHFAVYALNLALFVLVEQHGTFDILDNDFLTLASAFSCIASQSQSGRNLFHLFRQNVRAKCQGSRLRECPAVDDELKKLFDEQYTSWTLFDEYANGLEKLDQDERYRVLGEHRLSDMLDRYESLSLGKDDIARGRCSEQIHAPASKFNSAVNQNPNGVNPNPAVAAQSSNWMWRAGSFSSNLPPANYQAYPYAQFSDPNLPRQVSFQPAQDGGPARKVAIPRATAVKASAQRRRSARACESCRQRKVKCDGARPECRKCREHGLECSYIDIKRIRDQKQLGSLAEKVERYEKLMRQLEAEVDPSTARRIKRALAVGISVPTWAQSKGDGDVDDDGETSDADSTTTHGSLEDIDLVKEDLNRNAKSIATGYFGKNSEVAWMQKLEDVSDERAHDSQVNGDKSKDIPITTMSYHLDDLEIPLPEDVDSFGLPPKPLADLYLSAYMESVHPSFAVVRKYMFMDQYEDLFQNNKLYSTPHKWLAVLNMIFALGCRYCKLTGRIAAGGPDTDDGQYLSRARKLCLGQSVLFDHDDLQQIQINLLVAFYLVALGQINRASKFSSMALRAAISLGINLRFKDDNTPYSSKEARNRLWWSIFLLEHMLTSITGRLSGCGEELSAALLPIPFDEEESGRKLNEIFRNPVSQQSSRLQLTLYQTEDEASSTAAWIAKCEPSSTLMFHCIVDLVIIAQTVINSVYSIQGLRETSGQVEARLQKHSRSMDTWLRKVPAPYRFTVSLKDDNYYIPANASYVRERITLAMYYYSARITLCRPCVSHTSASLQKARDPSSRSRFRALMTLCCLSASCSLLSILPDHPDAIWLTTVTPWWAILHFIMQATTALLIGLSVRPPSASELNTDQDPNLPNLSRDNMVRETQKAFRWLHHLAATSTAARRAFVLCDNFLRRMGPSLGIDLAGLPGQETLPSLGKGGGGNPGMGVEVDMLNGQSQGDGYGFGFGFGYGYGYMDGFGYADGLVMVDDI
ncbi:fungal-specific transcription factor domain-containing protein [Aspergillus spectabilis]